MASISITQSFDIALHDIVLHNRSPKAHISGESTRAAEAPARCSETHFHYWDDTAQAVINNVRNRLDVLRLAKLEPTRRIESEGDVSDAAAVHLTNPVDLALDAQYPGRVAVYNQMTKGSARADRVYSFSGDLHYFAVMDYKTAGVIRSREIWNAIRSRRSRTSYEENLLVLLKQAVHYACAYSTSYVCFFDYNSLLLINLTDADINPAERTNQPLGGDTCEMTLVTDKGCMRRALLGFLARAYAWRVEEDREAARRAEEDRIARSYRGGRDYTHRDAGYGGHGSSDSAGLGGRYGRPYR